MLFFAVVASAQMLSADAVEQDIQLAQEVLARVHAGYGRYEAPDGLQTSLQRIVDDAQQRGGLSEAELYLRLQHALVLLHCDHTKVELSESLGDAVGQAPNYLPVSWAVVDGHALVTADDDALGLLRGDDIVQLDGRDMQQVLDEARSYIPYDGDTVWARDAGLAVSLEFQGGAVDLFNGLSGPVDPVASLVVARDGERFDVAVPRVDFDEWSNGMVQSETRNFGDAVRFERVGDTAAVLTIDTFVNYRNPVKPADVYDPIFDALAAEGRRHLIVDLRRNGGGSSDAQIELLRRLIPQRFRLARDMRVRTLDLDGIREHLWTWDKRALRPNRLGFRRNDDGTYSIRKLVASDRRWKRPARNGFGGSLIVLTSHANGSASTSLMAVLREHSDATFVGEQTGGSAEGPTAGILFFLTLPNSGLRVRVPAIRYYNDVDAFEPGLGISPDVAAPMTVDAFHRGIDPAMQAALERVEATLGAAE